MLQLICSYVQVLTQDTCLKLCFQWRRYHSEPQPAPDDAIKIRAEAKHRRVSAIPLRSLSGELIAAHHEEADATGLSPSSSALAQNTPPKGQALLLD